MFGFNEDVGVLRWSGAYIMGKSPLQATTIEVTDKNIFDLTTGNKKPMTKNDKPTVKEINTPGEFDAFVEQMTRIRLQKATNQNQTSSRSHLIFVITARNNPKCQILFADLAGFENSTGKENLGETVFINKTLMELNQVLLSVSRKQIANFQANALTSFLKPYLGSNSQTMMLYHISKESIKKGLEYIKDIVASHKTPLKRPSPNSQQSNSKILKVASMRN